MPRTDALPPVTERPVTPDDLPAISALHDRVFGPGRFARTAYRVRESAPAGTGGCSRFCRLAMRGNELVAALRLTEITIGAEGGALLLGPLVVATEVAGQGFGRALVGNALEHAKAAGVKLIVLVGDESYYGRFGFKPVPPGQIVFPGPVNPARILAAELIDGARSLFHGLVKAAL